MTSPGPTPLCRGRNLQRGSRSCRAGRREHAPDRHAGGRWIASPPFFIRTCQLVRDTERAGQFRGAPSIHTANGTTNPVQGVRGGRQLRAFGAGATAAPPRFPPAMERRCLSETGLELNRARPDLNHQERFETMDDNASTSDWSSGAAYVDGQVTPIKDAKIPMMDWGLPALRYHLLTSSACITGPFSGWTITSGASARR